MKRLLATLFLLAIPASGQVVERGRTFADLTASHPCASGLTERIARVIDCDAADDVGDGEGAFQCWVRCDGTAPWETVAIGAGAGGAGVSGLTTADGGAALADNVVIRGDGATGIQGSTVTLADSTGNLQWEGATADDFEGNFTFSDPTADWTWAWGADGALTGVGGMSVNANGRIQTGNGANGGINLGGAGARISDSNNDGRLDFIAGGVSQMDMIDVGGGTYRLRLTAGGGASIANIYSLTKLDWNGDTDLFRHALRVLKLTDINGDNISSLLGGGAAVASAAALPVPTGAIFHVTGTTNVTSITATNLASGLCFTMIFDDVLTFTDGNNIKIAGNFVTTADDTLSVCFDGTNFYETARSIN